MKEVKPSAKRGGEMRRRDGSEWKKPLQIKGRKEQRKERTHKALEGPSEAERRGSYFRRDTNVPNCMTFLQQCSVAQM